MKDQVQKPKRTVDDTAIAATTKKDKKKGNKPMLVIDKAFIEAKKAKCSIISIRLIEVYKLLQAIGYSPSKTERDILKMYTTIDSLELSLTSKVAFCGSFTGYCKRYGLFDGANFNCTEEMV